MKWRIGKKIYKGTKTERIQGKIWNKKKLWKEPVNQCGCINKHYLAIIMKKKFHNVKKLTGDKSLDPVWSSFLAAL